MAETFSQGNVPWWTNPERVLEAKILNVIAGGGGGGGAGGGAGSIFRGTTNDPNGVVTCGTSAGLYYNENTGAWWQFEGGAGSNVGWVEIISA